MPLTSSPSRRQAHQGPVTASCCWAHLLASSSSLASLSLLFFALCSLISRSFLSFLLSNSSLSSLSLRTPVWTKGQASATPCFNTGDGLSADAPLPNSLFVKELLELSERKQQQQKKKKKQTKQKKQNKTKRQLLKVYKANYIKSQTTRKQMEKCTNKYYHQIRESKER